MVWRALLPEAGPSHLFDGPLPRPHNGLNLLSNPFQQRSCLTAARLFEHLDLQTTEWILHSAASCAATSTGVKGTSSIFHLFVPKCQFFETLMFELLTAWRTNWFLHNSSTCPTNFLSARQKPLPYPHHHTTTALASAARRGKHLRIPRQTYPTSNLREAPKTSKQVGPSLGQKRKLLHAAVR